MIILVIILSVILIISLFFNFKLYKIANFQLEKSDLYEAWIKEMRDDIRVTYLEMRNIDERHMFEKDDDVGIVFQELLSTIDKLNDRIQDESDDEDVDQK